MTQFEIPVGSRTALISRDWSLNFDEVHCLRREIRKAFDEQVKKTPLRVIGCLHDNESALFALLCITEFTDYLPINPNLSDIEIENLVQNSVADYAILSATFIQEKAHLFHSIRLLDWDAIIEKAWERMNPNQARSHFTRPEGKGRLILHTSGSTGLPKRVPLEIEAINASAKSIAKGHQLSFQDHALNALPTFHIGALVDVLLAPWSAGGAVSITDQRAPKQLAQEIIAKRPTWIQVVPTILRRMVEDLEPEILRNVGQSLKFIRSISAPVPADLKETAEDAFNCRVIEMYGMTETAGQIATNSRDQTDAKLGSVGRAIGIDVAILDGYGNPVETGKTGEICVSGPSVFDGYEDMAKEQVFFDTWFRTGDLGLLDADGYLYLRGRLKEMINVGGEKVSPHEVETTVLRMPDVIEAAAYALPHPTLGEQVGLTVATRTPVQEAPIKAFLKVQLVDFKCPNTITVLDQLPRLANAKIDRVLLKREGEKAWLNRADAHTVLPSPASPIAKTVSEQWVRILKCRPPLEQDDFFDMGGDSLSATQFLLNLERALNRDISPNQLFEKPTFSGLVGALSDTSEGPAITESRAVKFVRQNMAGWPGRAMLPGGLMHGIGSMKSTTPLFWSCQDSEEIQAISETIGRDRPLFFSGSLFKYKNRKVTDFEDLAQQLAAEINSLQPEGPISLGGFCGGAHVMLHTAKFLQDMGRDIRIFISFDYWPDRIVAFPMLHCMSNCRTNSVRARFPHFDLALDTLHPFGSLAFEINSDHRFNLGDLRPYVAPIVEIIDGTKPVPVPQARTDKSWNLAKRLEAPKAKMRIQIAPRFYIKGSESTVKVAITNRSEYVWETTDLSGLAVQIDLVNLDGHMRNAGAGYASFEKSIAPNETVEVTLDIVFPLKRIPIWMSCVLTNQGLARFDTKYSGATRRLMMPAM